MIGRDLVPLYDIYGGYNSVCLRVKATGRTFNRPVEDTPKRFDFQTAVEIPAYGHIFCLFNDGRVGWVPEQAEVGDQVIIFLGASTRILLRPKGNAYIVVGDTYVHGMMDGQAFEDPDVKIETITLI